MRVTNTMLTSSSSYYINQAKNALLTAETQYTTQKKIQRASDDPTIAVRTLQLRTTYSKLTQYVDKNVQDAMSWMDSTESAISNIDNILTYMKSYFNEGANDYLASDEREAVLATLKEYAAAIFQDEANTDYSGRYVFTGYRTDTSLLFEEDTDNLEYEITQEFTNSDIETISYVYGGATYDEGTTAAEYAQQVATLDTAYHLKLAYTNCSDSAITSGGSIGDEAIQIVTTASDGTETTLVTATVSAADLEAYGGSYEDYMEDNSCDAIYLYETGEVIFSADTYSDIQSNSSTLSITYSKKEFEQYDLRPEMYFACTSYNTTSERVIEYSDPSDQDIAYEVNLTQSTVVNTQAKDAISTEIYRVVDYLEQVINNVTDVENQIADVETLISNTTDETELANLEQLKSQLEEEQDLWTSCMTEAFGKGLTMVDNAQSQLDVALADLGARYNRLELTYNKLLDQQVDTEETLSDTEDIDIADAYINLTEANNLYEASLLATSKILSNSLLNYI